MVVKKERLKYEDCDCLVGRVYNNADESGQWVPCLECERGLETDPGDDIEAIERLLGDK